MQTHPLENKVFYTHLIILKLMCSGAEAMRRDRTKGNLVYLNNLLTLYQITTLFKFFLLQTVILYIHLGQKEAWPFLILSFLRHLEKLKAKTKCWSVSLKVDKHVTNMDKTRRIMIRDWNSLILEYLTWHILDHIFFFSRICWQEILWCR